MGWRLWLIGFLALASSSCGERGQSKSLTDPNWYEGGNLHRATAAEWDTASSSNQLATAADWSVTALGTSRAQALGWDGIRLHAEQIVFCVNEAIANGPRDQPVSEVAAGCVALLR